MRPYNQILFNTAFPNSFNKCKRIFKIRQALSQKRHTCIIEARGQQAMARRPVLACQTKLHGPLTKLSGSLRFHSL